MQAVRAARFDRAATNLEKTCLLGHLEHVAGVAGQRQEQLVKHVLPFFKPNSRRSQNSNGTELKSLWGIPYCTCIHRSHGRLADNSRDGVRHSDVREASPRTGIVREDRGQVNKASQVAQRGVMTINPQPHYYN